MEGRWLPPLSRCGLLVAIDACNSQYSATINHPLTAIEVKGPDLHRANVGHRFVQIQQAAQPAQLARTTSERAEGPVSQNLIFE
jgi:hypothetical protein